MAGLYTHTSSAAGTVMTATLYNTDHQNHIDNHDPEMMDDISPNAAGMQGTVDPYPGSTESLATNLAGELQRIRYVLDEHLTAMSGGVAPSPGYWYVPTDDTLGFLTRGVHVKRSALFTCANAAWTAIPFDLEEDDDDDFHSIVSNTERLVIPSTDFEGKYLVNACVQFTGHATGYRGLRIVREVAIGPSTEVISQHVIDVDATTDHCIHLSTIIHLLVSDYLTLEAYQNSTATNDLTLEAEYAPRFMAWRIGR